MPAECVNYLPPTLVELQMDDAGEFMLSRDTKLPASLRKLKLNYGDVSASEVKMVRATHFENLPANNCNLYFWLRACDIQGKKVAPAMPRTIKFLELSWVSSVLDWLPLLGDVEQLCVEYRTYSGEKPQKLHLPQSIRKLTISNPPELTTITACHNVTHLALSLYGGEANWNTFWQAFPNITHLSVYINSTCQINKQLFSRVPATLQNVQLEGNKNNCDKLKELLRAQAVPI
jgi:hypothetical protein